MASNDDRSVFQVVADEDGKPSLQSLNEILRQIQMNVYKIEGRLGESTIRDNLRVKGKETWEGQSTQIGETSSGVIYFDKTLNKFRASENAGAMTNLIASATSLSVKILYVDTTVYTTPGTSEFFTSSYTLPGGTLAQVGDYVDVITHTDYANNVNSKTRTLYFGASSHVNTTTSQNVTYKYWANIMRLTATTQYGAAMSMVGSGGIIIGSFAPSLAETLANDIIIKASLTTPTAAGDLTQRSFAVILYRVNPTS